MNKIIKYMGNSPNSPITLRGLVDSRFARRIIGSKGNVHQFIQTTHEVRLYLDPHYDRYGRLCSIAGPVPNVAKAWIEVIEIIFRNADKIGRVWLTLLIPLELTLKLQDATAFKAKGSVLNEIANSTCTKIIVRPVALPNTTEHLMEVSIDVTNTNYLDNFTKALSLIGRQFQIHRHEALSPKNIYYTPFCYERPPIMDDDDDEEEQEEQQNHAHHQGKENGNNRQQSQQPQYQSYNKDKGKTTFNAHHHHPPPRQATASSAPSSSSPSLLSPIISQVAIMTVSPASIVSQFDRTITTATTSNDHFIYQ